MKKCKHTFMGEPRPVRYIAECLNIAERTLRNRFEECKKRGWPDEYAYDHKRWRNNKTVYYPCPDGMARTTYQIADELGVHVGTVRYRIKKLKKLKAPIELVWDKDFWKVGRPVEENPEDDKILPQEQAMLDKIPGPSPLEQAVFG